MEHETANQTVKKRKTIKTGIKLKLLGVLLPVVICIISVIISLIYRDTSAIIVRKSEELLKTSTESVINQVNIWTTETLTALDMERDTLEYFSLDKQAELDYIRHTVDKYPSFPSGIYIGNPDGTLTHESFVPDDSYNLFEKAWYIDGLKSEEFVFTPVYLDAITGSNVVSASGMIKDKNGEVRGVACADIYLDSIAGIVKDVRLEKTGGMFLVDSNTGIIIGHREEALVGSLLDDQPDAMYPYISKLITGNNTGLQTYTSPEGGVMYLDVEKVPGSNWVTVAYVPHSEVVADLLALTSEIGLISVIGILLLSILMERLVHLIIRPVKKLNKTIAAITDGDFTVDANVSTRDEIGLMAHSIQNFISTMRGIISQITEVAGRLDEQSVSSAQVSDSLSKAAGLQSSSMSDMTSTVGELAQSISQVAESATSLSHFVADTQDTGCTADRQMKTAVQSSLTGREDMQMVLNAMKDISEKMDHLEKSAVKMEGSVTQINSIVELIRDIAEETNLLSLNASIEAARAGAAGRGFAVVADQIGKLALNSKDAVDDISSLTSDISSLVEQTVQETKDSAESIKNSSRIVDETEAAFNMIYETVNQASVSVSDMIEKISNVNDIATSVAGITEEQSAASQEILATTETMQANAENVLDSSQTVDAAAKDLKDSAARLKEHLSLFRL